MRVSKVIAAIATGGVGLAGVPALAAANTVCDFNEVCFYQDHNLVGAIYDTANTDQSHNNLVFSNGQGLKDDAESIWNRDNACDIRVIDDRGFYPDDWQDVAQGDWANLIGSVDNENDRHESRNC